MMETFTTNNHLKKVIGNLNEFFDKGEDVPLELLFKFICELKVSNLLVPAFDDGEYFSFENIVSDEDETTYIPLFTDIDEYNKHDSGEDEYDPMAFDFDVYLDLVLEEALDGIVINVEGDYMTLDYDFLESMNIEISTISDKGGGEYGAEELREMFEKVSNDSLIEFINSKNSDDIEKLYVELSNSVLLNVVISHESLEENANEGIIDVSDFEGLNLCAVEDEDLCFATIFTSKDAIEVLTSQQSELFCYGQITVLSELFDYVLRNDMDGVIINPNGDDYVIARDDILAQASDIEVIVENPKFKNSLDYAFLL